MIEAVNLAHSIFDYEDGQLSEDETIELFAHLISTGLAWHLQGSYGRTARSLIQAGVITTDGEVRGGDDQ